VGGFTHYGPTTVPDSRTNDETPTGIDLTVLDPPALTMRVRLGNPLAAPGWPVGFGGSDVRDPLNRADLNGDGFEEVLLAAGTTIFALTSEAQGFDEEGERVLFSSFPDTLLRGPAVALERSGFGDLAPIIGAAAAGQASWFDPNASLVAVWPEATAARRVTAGPLPGPDLWVVGTSDGAITALRQGVGAEMETLWSVAPDGIDSLVCLLSGRTSPESATWYAAADASGRVFAALEDQEGAPPVVAAGWPATVASGPIEGLLAFRAPLRQGEDPIDLLLVAAVDRTIDLRRIDGGTSLPGWPREAADTLAGPPILGDPDADGVLEVIATTRQGTVHRWNLEGVPEPTWPKSVWHPDQVRRPDCTSAPVLWDLHADGSIELVQLRGDGILVVLDSSGEPVHEEARAMGAPGRAGPLRAIAQDGRERWYASTALSDSLLALSALAFDESQLVVDDAPGCFPAPGAGAGRGGVLPSSLVPVPRGAETFLDEELLLLHPNPLLGDDLQIRYVLGSRARMRGEIFDVSGRKQAAEEWEANAGAAGETHRWDLGALAPGYYVLRLQVDGHAERRTLFRSIAVVR
jgi:hypothetical protein